MKGFKDSKGRFRPTENKNGVRKSRDQSTKTQGVRLKREHSDDWSKLNDYNPKFMKFMNRVDQTSERELKELIFEPLDQEYSDTGGSYNFHDKHNYDDIIDYTLKVDGRETLDDYKKFFINHPEVIKKFMNRKVEQDEDYMKARLLDEYFELSKGGSAETTGTRKGAIKYLISKGIDPETAKWAVHDGFNGFDWLGQDKITYIDGSDVPTSGFYE